MNWLAKINLKIVVARLGPFKSALLLIFIIAIALFSGYRLGNFYHAFQAQKIEHLQGRLNHLYQEQAKQTSVINTMAVELEVERLANTQSMNLLKEIEKEHYQVKTQLAFYEKVMAPEKEADGIVIDKMIITPTESPEHYRFQAVLVQQKKSKRYAKGYVDFTIQGSQNNKPKTLTLKDLGLVEKSSLSFSFQYFQVVEGEFSLPSDFTAEQLQLAVVLPKGRWQKYHRLNEKYLWQNILQSPLNP